MRLYMPLMIASSLAVRPPRCAPFPFAFKRGDISMKRDMLMNISLERSTVGVIHYHDHPTLRPLAMETCVAVEPIFELVGDRE